MNALWRKSVLTESIQLCNRLHNTMKFDSYQSIIFPANSLLIHLFKTSMRIAD